jgi:hypothetical protein
MVHIHRILIHQQAASAPVAENFRRAFPGAEFSIIPGEQEIRALPADRAHRLHRPPHRPLRQPVPSPPGHPLRALLEIHRRDLLPPGLPLLLPQPDLPLPPYVRIASNIERGLEQAEHLLLQEAARSRRVMFNIGELADGRLLDPVTGLSRHLLPLLDRHPNGMLHVLTKAGPETIGNYLELAHMAPGRVIHVASVNPQIVINLTEEDTPPLESRLEALRRLQRAGYRIRLRIDPIFDLRDFGYDEATALREYERLVEAIRAYCTPELVTLGSYRPDPRLPQFLRRRYPDSPVLKVQTLPDGPKRRLPARALFYRRLVDRLRAAFPGLRIALCKETPQMWRAAGLWPAPLECSCLPLVEERKISR